MGLKDEYNDHNDKWEDISQPATRKEWVQVPSSYILQHTQDDSGYNGPANGVCPSQQDDCESFQADLSEGNQYTRYATQEDTANHTDHKCNHP